MMRLAVAHLFTVASARAAGGPGAWTWCAGENGTCHCPGGAVRLGWAPSPCAMPTCAEGRVGTSWI